MLKKFYKKNQNLINLKLSFLLISKDFLHSKRFIQIIVIFYKFKSIIFYSKVIAYRILQKILIFNIFKYIFI